MKHKYSAPKHPIMFEYLGRVKWYILKATSVGTIISAIATGLGIYILTAKEHESIRIALAVISPFFIEGLTHAFSQLSAEGVGNAIRHKNKRITYLILTCLFCLLLVLVAYANVSISVLAGHKAIDYAFGEVKTTSADMTVYNSLSDNADKLFLADSLKVLNLSNANFNQQKDKLGQEKRQVENRLAVLQKGYKQTPWFDSQIRQNRTRLKDIKEELKQLPTTVRQAQKDSMNAARARYAIAIQKANTEKIRATEENKVINNMAIDKHEKAKGDWKGILTFLIIAGVFSAIVRYSYLELRNILGGRSRVTLIDENERKVNLFVRAYKAIYTLAYSNIEILVERMEGWSEPTRKEITGSKVVPSEEPPTAQIAFKTAENSVEIEKEITRLIDRTKKQYSRSFTAASERSQQANRAKAEQGIKELRNRGYIVRKEDQKLQVTQKIKK